MPQTARATLDFLWTGDKCLEGTTFDMHVCLRDCSQMTITPAEAIVLVDGGPETS